jgi:pimeloyl-ACP methyl ester carboxylesterase
MLLDVDGKKAFAYTAAHELDPGQPTVAFLHGAGLDHSWFGLQSRFFGYHGCNVLALDFPGHGRSDGPALPSVERMAEWVTHFLDAVRIRSASLVGHSLGSLVALECAGHYPERVERIALIGTAYPMKVGDAFLEAARKNEQTAFDMDTIWAHAPKVPLGGNPNPGMWMYGDTLARLARLAPGVLHSDLKACNDYAGGLEAAAKVRCPALFILGDRDQMTPRKAAGALVNALPGARTVALPSGHSIMAEAPDATLDALIEFIPSPALMK